MMTWENFTRIMASSAFPFFIGILPPVVLLCLPCKRRPHPALRVLLLPVCILLFGSAATYILIRQTYGGPRYLIIVIQYMILLAGVFFIMQCFFEGSLSLMLFNLLGGLAWYQICLFILYIFYNLVNIPVISEQAQEAHYILQSVLLLPAYFFIYQLFLKGQNRSADNAMDAKRPELYISIAVSLFLIVFNVVRNSEIEPRSTMDYMCLVCLILFYVLILLLRSGLLTIIRNEKEILLNQKIWEEKEKSLKLTAETANAISIKYHDLKHLVSNLSGVDTDKLVAEVTDCLQAYEHTFSTGNDTLDMVLTEQSLRFHQNGVLFSCIVDGGALSFMGALDVISLFSNALDNAYEAVAVLPVEKREICLTVKQVMGMVSIVVENPCANAVTIKNGLPVTTKHDKQFHGFGVKSIHSVVEKYDGDLLISTEGNWFKLKILIPRRS